MGMLEEEVETTLRSPVSMRGGPEELDPAVLPRIPSPAGSPSPGVTPYTSSATGSPVLGGSFGAMPQGFHGDIPTLPLTLPLSLFGPGVGEVPVAQKHFIFLTAVMNGTGGDKRLSLLYMESLVPLLAEEAFSSTHLTIHVLIRYDLNSLDQLKYLIESCDKLKSEKVDFKIYFVNQHSHYHRVTKFESIDDATTFTYDKEAKSIKFPSKYLSIIPSPEEFFGPVAGGKKVKDWEVGSWYSSCEQLLRRLCEGISSTVPITLILTHSHMTTYDESLSFMKLLPAGARFFLANSPHRWICLPFAIKSTLDIRTLPCRMKIAFSEDKPALLTSRLRERFSAASTFHENFLKLYRSNKDGAYALFKAELGKDVPRDIFNTIFESENVFLGYWNFDKDAELRFAKKFLGEVSQLPGGDKVIVVTGCKRLEDFKRLQQAIKQHHLDKDSSFVFTEVDIPEGTTYFRYQYQLLDADRAVNCTVVAMSFINPKIFDFLLLKSQPLVAMTGEDSVLHAMCYFKKVVCYQCVNGTAEYKDMLLKIMEGVHSELKGATASADAVAKLIQYYKAGLSDASVSNMVQLESAAAVVSEKLIAVADTTAGEVLKLCQWLTEASADLTPTEADKKADEEARARLLIFEEMTQRGSLINTESAERKAILAHWSQGAAAKTKRAMAVDGSAPPPSAGGREPGNRGLRLAGGTLPSSRPSP